MRWPFRVIDANGNCTSPGAQDGNAVDADEPAASPLAGIP